jgi:DNA-binding NtrC family response regulator
MPHILVVDDEAEIRSSVRRILETKGHQVTEAPDGKTALRHFAGNPADLVISDVYMPDMDGIEFLIRVREAFPEAKIVVMSGGGHMTKEKVLGAASLLGAAEILEKPFTIEEILEVVGRTLEG